MDMPFLTLESLFRLLNSIKQPLQHPEMSKPSLRQAASAQNQTLLCKRANSDAVPLVHRLTHACAI